MSDVPYPQILSDIQALEAELRSWGLHQGPDRLSAAAEKLRIVVNAVEAGRAMELEGRADFEDLVYATIEAREFSEVHRGLQPMNQGELRPLFEKALVGRVNPETDLAGRESLGRNTVFQLWVAASLRANGQQISLEQDCDVLLQLPFGQVLIECKRPYRAQNVGSNIDEAHRQLRSNLPKYGGGTAGVVAVSLSRAFIDTGRKLLRVNDAHDPTERLQEDFHAFHVQHYRDDPVIDLRIIGALYHVAVPALIRGRLFTLTFAELFGGSIPMQTVWPVDRGQAFLRTIKESMG